MSVLQETAPIVSPGTFVAGLDGQVWTASSDKGVWLPLPGIRVGSNTQVAAASPFTDQLTIFAVDVNGNLQTATWYPYFGGFWTAWQQIGGVQLSPGAPVTAISRGYGELELFVTDVNGHIQTTTWYPSFSGSWKLIGVAAPGAWTAGRKAMISFSGSLKIFLLVDCCDMRKGFNGLYGLVSSSFGEDPRSGALYVFCNRRHSRIKVLYFDGTGLWVLSKRLERGTFSWPKPSQSESPKLKLSPEAFAMLTDGVDLRGAKLRPWYERE